MWYRVFGLNEVEIPPATLQEALQAVGCTAPFHVRGDDLGWTQIDVPCEPPLQFKRFLTNEDEIRDNLDAWAAWLETQEQDPHHEPLMQLVISTKQMVTFRRPFDDDQLEMIGETAARTLASFLRGVYQIDGRGFFGPDGSLILKEA